MAKVSDIVSDKLLHEDLKNVIIKNDNGVIKFIAYAGNIITSLTVDGVIEGDLVDYIQLKAKDIVDVLGTFKSLRKTRVTKVEIRVRENEAVLHVFEEGADSESQYVEDYKQESKFRITKSKIKEVVRAEISKLQVNNGGVELNTPDVLFYLNALYSAVSKETREATNNVLFSESHAYAVLPSYTAVIDNQLPNVMSGFRLVNGVVNFLKSFISGTDSFKLIKHDMGNGLIVLEVHLENAIAHIKCADMSRAFDISNFISIPSNGIVVDRLYIIDILKRINLNSDVLFLEVNIDNSSMKVVSKTMTQNIPVFKAKGEGVFQFSIRPELLSSLLFTNVNVAEHSFLYFEKGDKNNIIMVSMDNTKLWQTKINGLAEAKADFNWN
jgi:hypothetical protein